MWENWVLWILVGGLVLLMFRRGGCCGHAGHGTSGNRGDGKQKNDETARRGCH